MVLAVTLLLTKFGEEIESPMVTGWTGLFLDPISSWSFAGSWGTGLGFVNEELAPLQLCGDKGERKHMLIELLQYLGTKGWTHEAIPSDTALHLASWTAQQLKAQTSSLPLFFLMLLTGVNWHKMKKELDISC